MYHGHRSTRLHVKAEQIKRKGVIALHQRAMSQQLQPAPVPPVGFRTAAPCGAPAHIHEFLGAARSAVGGSRPVNGGQGRTWTSHSHAVNLRWSKASVSNPIVILLIEKRSRIQERNWQQVNPTGASGHSRWPAVTWSLAAAGWAAGSRGS